MDSHTKEKIKLLLEEKSLLEDEIVSIATLARNYQSQAKLSKEELEKLESSYDSICSQNSMLESELIRLNAQLQETEVENLALKAQLQDLKEQLSIAQTHSTQNVQTSSELERKNLELEQNLANCSSVLKQLNEECEELKELCSEKNNEIMALKEIVSKEKKNEAIKELSYIILSKDHHSSDSPIKNIKHNYQITDVLESKIKSLEQESQEYLSKYRSVLFKYIECLKEYKDQSALTLSKLPEAFSGKEDRLKAKLSYIDLEIEFSEFELERIECEEISYYTSFGESPAALEEPRKSRTSQLPIQYLVFQASIIESLLTRSSP